MFRLVCDDARWMCAAHPERRWPHDDCRAPGVPCPACPPDQPIETVFASVRRLARPPLLVVGDLFPCPSCGQWHVLSSHPNPPFATAQKMLFIFCESRPYFVGPVGGGVGPNPRSERIIAIHRKWLEAFRLLTRAQHETMHDQVRRVHHELNAGIGQLNQMIIDPSVFDDVDAMLARASARLNAIRRALEIEGPAAMWID